MSPLVEAIICKGLPETTPLGGQRLWAIMQNLKQNKNYHYLFRSKFQKFQEYIP
jgi:hypothetical protein